MPGMEGRLSAASASESRRNRPRKSALSRRRSAGESGNRSAGRNWSSAAQNAASRLSGVDPNKGLLGEEAADVIVQSFIGGAGANLPQGRCSVLAVRIRPLTKITQDLPIGSESDGETGRRCGS